jgi:penicillin-insensitive murein endopeptidase
VDEAIMMDDRYAGRRAACLCACASLLLASRAATQASKINAALAHTAEISLRPKLAQRSQSLGYPWDGQLLRYVPEYAPAARFYGTWQLVQLLERAARRVALRFPGSKLSIGELSGLRGGNVGGHRSHENGRDADIGFYMMRSDNRPYASSAFAQFDALGRGLAPNQGLRFDIARNWELVAKLVDDADAKVQFIFVCRTLRELLLREAARRQAPAAVVARAAAVMIEPSHGNPHRSHFHVRIYCSPSDRPQCLDVAPYRAWYPSGSLPARGAAPSMRRHTLALDTLARVAN